MGAGVLVEVVARTSVDAGAGVAVEVVVGTSVDAGAGVSVEVVVGTSVDAGAGVSVEVVVGTSVDAGAGVSVEVVVGTSVGAGAGAGSASLAQPLRTMAMARTPRTASHRIRKRNDVVIVSPFNVPVPPLCEMLRAVELVLSHARNDSC